jgi:hypothetical protein
MTTEEMHARLDAISWVGFSILALSAGAMVAVAVWYWQTGRKM